MLKQPQLTAEHLYFELGQLIAATPADLCQMKPSQEKTKWLAQSMALVECLGDSQLLLDLRAAVRRMGTTLQNSNDVMLCLHHALAKIELAAPIKARGTFIAAGSTFDAFAAVGKAVAEAKADVQFIDPYADEKLLSHYAHQAPEGISVQILAGDKNHKQTLISGGQAWVRQYGQQRPLEIRLAPDHMLHDRLILLDGGATVWIVGQSFNALASRAHTSLIRADDEMAQRKRAAYGAIWNAAASIAL